MTFNNKTYDVLKWIAQLLLPAIATVYFSLANIWGFPCAEQVIGTIAAVETGIGILLKISTANYKGDGTLQLNLGLDGEEPEAEIDIPFEKIAEKDKVTLNVETIAG